MNGTEVKATVIRVETKKVRGRERQIVTVTYENEDGGLITAKALNPGDVAENDTLVGKVVPEKPEEVYLEPSARMSLLVYGIAGLFYISALIVLVALIMGRNTGKRMAKEGKIAEAFIVRRELVDGFLFVDLEFKDDMGVIRHGTCRVPEYIDTNNRTCLIRYLPKSTDKAICEMSM